MSIQEDLPHRLYGATESADRQRRAIRSGAVPIAVYGLGKMGLPIAAVFAQVTGNVVGADIDDTVVEQISRGDCPMDHEPGLPGMIEDAVDRGALEATVEPRDAAEDASVHVVVVPTTVTDDEKPDLSALKSVVRDIGEALDEGDIVVIESTVPPGTCQETVEPMLVAASGLEPDSFGLAFCPERTASGRAIKDIRGAYPKIVGGIDTESTRVASLIYGEITTNEVHKVSSVTAAECVKVFEGVYRDVNIALANELARLSKELGVEAVEAIDAANTQPYCDIHVPGIGVGGHCIPYYPHFLIAPFETSTPLLETARQVNDSMPSHAMRVLEDRLEVRGTSVENASVLILGIAYRPGVPETRASPALTMAELLRTAGATVYAADPVIDELRTFDVIPTEIEELPKLDLDAAVLATAHEEFDDIDWTAFEDLVVIDGRQALDLQDTDIECYTIGGELDV